MLFYSFFKVNLKIYLFPEPLYDIFNSSNSSYCSNVLYIVVLLHLVHVCVPVSRLKIIYLKYN